MKRQVGWKLIIAPEIDVVKPPTREEVEFIRNFDPTDGILRKRAPVKNTDFASWNRTTYESLKTRI